MPIRKNDSGKKYHDSGFAYFSTKVHSKTLKKKTTGVSLFCWNLILKNTIPIGKNVNKKNSITKSVMCMLSLRDYNNS